LNSLSTIGLGTTDKYLTRFDKSLSLHSYSMLLDIFMQQVLKIGQIMLLIYLKKKTSGTYFRTSLPFWSLIVSDFPNEL